MESGLFCINIGQRVKRSLTCKRGKYLEVLVNVSFPRQAAATLRIASSEFSEFWKRGGHSVSATFSNCGTEQLVTSLE